MTTSWKVYAGGALLRTFRSALTADAYARDVIENSHPNIGTVELYKFAESDGFAGVVAEGAMVHDFGIPVGFAHERETMEPETLTVADLVYLQALLAHGTRHDMHASWDAKRDAMLDKLERVRDSLKRN
tara:strand:+ start:173 stop:559 length:387 start_codon:yes stop_codon:yes gene_type:complete